MQNANEPRNLERKKELLKDEASGKDKQLVAACEDDKATATATAKQQEQERETESESEMEEGYPVIIARV